MTQRMILIASPYFITPEQLRQGVAWDELFGNPNPLSLEIGCGTGHFIVELARRNPQRNYLAIDIFNRGCERTCRKLEREQLDNVRVARIEARQLLCEELAPQSLSEIFINCPDPWPKKRHRRRRLVNSEFLDIARHALRPQGEIFFVSDFDDYAREVGALLEQHSDFELSRAATFHHEPPDYPVSKYMRRFLELGQPLHFVHGRGGANVASSAPRPQARSGFRLRQDLAQ